MDIKFYLFIKKTVDWKNMTVEKYKDVSSRCGMVKFQEDKDKFQKVVETIKKWNKIFKISYFEYRNELKKITFAHIAKVKDLEDVLVNENDRYDGDYLNQNLPEGSIVLPIDDDDIFHPDIVPIIKNYLEPDVNLYCWNQCENRHNIRLEKVNKFIGESSCRTNNFCLVIPLSFNLIRYHLSTMRVQRKKIIDENLSIQNVTLAGTSQMRHGTVTKGNLLKKYNKYCKLASKSKKLLCIGKHSYEWCRECFEAIGELNKSLL